MGRPKAEERKDVRKLVLKAAKALFLKEGYTNITIREIAQSIGCTPAAIYHYFQCKDEILFELYTEAAKLLYQYQKKIADKLSASKHFSNPLEILRQSGLSYIDFALDNRDYYDLLFNLPMPINYLEKFKENASVDHINYAYGVLENIVQLCKSHGYFIDVDADTVSFALWSFVHGISALIISGRTPYDKPPPRQLAEQALDFLIKLATPCNLQPSRKVVKKTR